MIDEPLIDAKAALEASQKASQAIQDAEIIKLKKGFNEMVSQAVELGRTNIAVTLATKSGSTTKAFLKQLTDAGYSCKPASSTDPQAYEVSWAPPEIKSDRNIELGSL